MEFLQLWFLLLVASAHAFDTSQSVLDSRLEGFGIPLPQPAKPVTLPVGSPTKSFWTDSSGANPLAKVGSEGALIKDADVCIIGSGITGVSAAYHLSREKAFTGRTIAIFEARDFCSGATGRNGGHLTPTSFLDFSRRESLYGVDDAVKSYDLEDYTTQELLRIIRDNNASEEIDLVEGGHITLFLTPEEEEAARRDFETAKAAGLKRLDRAVWISGEAMNKTRGTSFPGVWTPGNNLWPLKLVTQLYRLASTKVNVTLYTHTPVTSIQRFTALSKAEFGLRTPRGDVGCDYILHATNAYANYLLDVKGTGIRVVPTRGQIIVVSSSDAGEIGKTGWGANEGFEYWFPRPFKGSEETTPSVVLGGGRETAGPRFEYYETDDGNVNAIVGRALRNFLPKVFPELFDELIQTLWEWTGIMGYTSTGNPFVGSLADLTSSSSRQYLSVGYTGHGMPRAYACAEAVVGMMVAEMRGSIWTPPPWFPSYFLVNRH